MEHADSQRRCQASHPPGRVLRHDHDFHSPEAEWTVPARVVPNGSGSLFMITFFQPPTFSDDFFDQQTVLVERELASLKQLLET